VLIYYTGKDAKQVLLPRGVLKGRPAPSVKEAVSRAIMDHQFKGTTNEYSEKDSKWKLKQYKTKWREVGRVAALVGSAAAQLPAQTSPAREGGVDSEGGKQLSKATATAAPGPQMPQMAIVSNNPVYDQEQDTGVTLEDSAPGMAHYQETGTAEIALEILPPNSISGGQPVTEATMDSAADESQTQQFPADGGGWGLMYCGGAAPVVAQLKEVSKEKNIPLSVESFAW